MKFRLINLKFLGDERGKLAAFEKNTNVPFDVKRVFYIWGTTNDCSRGCHANKESEFLLVTINGSCYIKVNDGRNSDVFILDTPSKALYLDKMVWKEMYNFSPDAILLILSNEKYNENEYIRDYKKFLEMVND